MANAYVDASGIVREKYGLAGSDEYDRHVRDIWTAFEMGDEDPSYASYLRDAAESSRRKAVRLVAEVGTAEFTAVPYGGGCLFVFDRKTPEDKYVSVAVYEDGSWDRNDITEDELSKCLCDRYREKFYESNFFDYFQDLKTLGFPVFEGKPLDRISHFATFADKLPGYKEGLAGYDAKLFVDRVARASRFEHGRAPTLEELAPAKPFLEKKAEYYLEASRREANPLVAERYLEKRDYWRMLAEGAEIPSEMAARCAPGHKPDAVDKFVCARHAVMVARTDEDREKYKMMMRRWEDIAAREKDAREHPSGKDAGSYADSAMLIGSRGAGKPGPEREYDNSYSW